MTLTHLKPTKHQRIIKCWLTAKEVDTAIANFIRMENATLARSMIFVCATGMQATAVVQKNGR